MIIFDADTRVDNTTSITTNNMDRIQVIYGNSGVTGVQIWAKTDSRAMSGALVVPEIVPSGADSDIFVIEPMPFMWLEFIGGDGSQMACVADIQE
jgi:hypothetical protein